MGLDFGLEVDEGGLEIEALPGVFELDLALIIAKLIGKPYPLLPTANGSQWFEHSQIN